MDGLLNETSLRQIALLFDLPKKAVMFCKTNKLINLGCILNHYRKHRTFINISGYNTENDQLLSNLCIRYNDQIANKPIFISIADKPLLVLAEIESLSRPCIRFCSDNNFKSLNDILLFYQINKSFFQIKNCNSTIDEELINIAKWNIDFIVESCNSNLNVINNSSFEDYEKISLLEVAEKETLSVRSINVCKDNELNNLCKIILYYKVHHTFLKLRNCGAKTEIELCRISRKYLNINGICNTNNVNKKEYTVLDDKNISLVDLFEKESLSARSFNVCKNNGILSLFDILLFYKKYNSFLELKNCGSRTEKELCDISIKYLNLLGLKIEETFDEKDPILLELKKLSPFKLYLLNQHFDALVSSLSTRSKNVISQLQQSIENKIEIIEKICNLNTNFYKYRNIGQTSNYEFIELRNNLRV